MTSLMSNSSAINEEMQVGRRKISPKPSLFATSENLQLKNVRSLSNLLRPFPNKFGSYNSTSKELLAKGEYSYNKKICLLMNEFYNNDLSDYEDRTNRILDELKSITDPYTANSVFFSVSQNLKYHVKKIRNNLHGKLRKLGLLYTVNNRRSPIRGRSRIYSADSLWWDGAMHNVLKSFHGAESNYIEFLTDLCKAYEDFCEATSRGPERICHKLLSFYKSTTEIAKYNVHKAAFRKYVLNNCVISVNLHLIL